MDRKTCLSSTHWIPWTRLREALKKIRDQQNIIKLLQRQLEQTSEALQDSKQNKAELNELLHATLNSPGSFPTLVPTGAQTRPIETPGPHRLPSALKTLPIKSDSTNKVNANNNKTRTPPPTLQPNPR